MVALTMDPYTIIQYPLMTEKTTRLMQNENKLAFIVDRGANKNDIKKAVEQAFKIKVLKVNTYITTTGKKRAYIKLAKENPAIDIATQMGLV